MGINSGLALWFTQCMGVAGIALAFSIASFINMIVLLIIIHVKLGGLDDRRIIASVLKIIVACLIMILVVQGLSFHRGDVAVDVFPGIKGLVANWVDMQTFWGVFVQAALATLVGLGVYFLIGWLIKLEEVSMVKGLMNKLKLRKAKQDA